MIFFFWFCVFFLFFYFSLFFSRVLCIFFLKGKKYTFYFLTMFLIFIFCFVLYFNVGGSGLISFYYNENVVLTRRQQGNLRVILHKFNSQLMKLKYSVIKEPEVGTNWYSLGKLYEVQQNYTQSMNSFYKAYKLDISNTAYLTSYIMNKFILTKGNILNAYDISCVDILLKVTPSSPVLLSIISVDYLLNTYTI